MDYATSGVDIDAEGAAIASLIGSLSGSVRKPGTRGAPVPLPGGFGGIIEFGNSRLAWRRMELALNFNWRINLADIKELGLIVWQ